MRSTIHRTSRHLTPGFFILLGMLLLIPTAFANAAPLSGVRLTASRTSPQRVNTYIQLTATPTGGTTVQYQFLAGTVSGSSIQWKIVRSYSTNNRYTWHPLYTGIYRLEVRAREIGQTFEYTAGLDYVIISTPLTSVSMQVSPTSPRMIMTPIALTAVPSGSGAIVYQFQTSLPLADGSVHTETIQEYSTTKTITWLPRQIGMYTLRVNARQGLTGARVYSATRTYTVTALAGTGAGGYLSVAHFRGDKPAAISYTFDDGQQTQITGAVPLLDAVGFKATFFVIAGFAPDVNSGPVDPSASASWDEWKKVQAKGQAKGHEIGNHSMTHPYLRQIIDEAELQHEIRDSVFRIHQKLGEYPISFAYPYNDYTTHIREVVKIDHVADRLDNIYFGGNDFTAIYANAVVNQAIANRQWIVPMIHGIDVGGWMPLPSSELRKHFQYVKSREADVWVETFGKANLYFFERDAAVLQIHALQDHSMTFTVTTPLYGAIFNYPLTIKVSTGTGILATNVTAARAGAVTPLPTTVKPGSILVDVVPGDAAVTVSWQ